MTNAEFEEFEKDPVAYRKKESRRTTVKTVIAVTLGLCVAVAIGLAIDSWLWSSCAGWCERPDLIEMECWCLDEDGTPKRPIRMETPR